MVPRPLPHLVCSMDTQQACARLGSFVAHHGPRSGRTGIPGALVFRSSSVKSTSESKGDMGPPCGVPSRFGLTSPPAIIRLAGRYHLSWRSVMRQAGRSISTPCGPGQCTPASGSDPPFPTLSGPVAQWQRTRLPSVRCVTFTLIPAASTSTPSVQILGFTIMAPCPVLPPHAVPVRRASALPAASFRFHLAMDTLAVRLMVPLTGPIGDLHPQVIRPAPPAPEQRRQGATRHAWRTIKKPAARRLPVFDYLID